MDQFALPDPILRIILIEYDNIDYEDIITKNTNIDDFRCIQRIICPFYSESDHNCAMRACTKADNATLAKHLGEEYGFWISDTLATDCIKIASKYGQLDTFILMIENIDDTYGKRYDILMLCTRISLRNGQFHIIDWIIENCGSKYIKQEANNVLKNPHKLSISREICRRYTKYVRHTSERSE
jgi:hypothetical protein